MKGERNILYTKNLHGREEYCVYILLRILRKIRGETLAHVVREVSVHEDDEVPSRMLYPMNVGSS